MTAPGTRPDDEALERELRDLPPVPADGAFRARMREAFATGTIRPVDGGRGGSSRPRGRILAFRLGALAAAVAAVLLLIAWGDRGPGVELLEARGAGVVLVDGVAVPAGDRAALAGAIGPGSEIQVPEAGGLDLVVPETAVLELAGGTVVKLPEAYGRWWRDETSMSIRAGTVRFASGPGFRGRSLRIVTPQGVAVVTGTAISVDCMEGLTCVCVLEGTAMVGPDDGDLEPVESGSRMVLLPAGERKRDAVVPPHIEGIREMLRRTADRFPR